LLAFGWNATFRRRQGYGGQAGRVGWSVRRQPWFHPQILKTRPEGGFRLNSIPG
jgi:hypothetical protein